MDELAYVRDRYGAVFSSRQLFDMVTRNPGRLMSGAENRIGVIAEGAVADFCLLAVPNVPETETTAYNAALSNSSVNNVRGVVIQGRPILGSNDFCSYAGESFTLTGERNEVLHRRVFLHSSVGKYSSLSGLQQMIGETFRSTTHSSRAIAPLWEPVNLV
jgi:subtilase family serine protease